jgi:hypothetical protein
VKRAGAAPLVLAASTVIALVAAVITGVGSAMPAKCEPGVRAVGGQYVRVFCGPGRATLVVAGRTYRFRSGECFRSKDFTNVNIGTYTVSGAPLGRYLRVVGPSRDGTTRRGSVSWQLPGILDGISRAQLTLKAKGTRGSFSGRTRSGRPASGSFNCV